MCLFPAEREVYVITNSINDNKQRDMNERIGARLPLKKLLAMRPQGTIFAPAVLVSMGLQVEMEGESFPISCESARDFT